MVALLRVVAVAVLVTGLGGTARAGKIAVANVSAEPDLADEAGAVTLLVRSGLMGDDRALIDAPTGITVGGALVILEKAGADHAVLMDLGRDGLKLRLNVVIVATKAQPVVKVVRAGDGDVGTLAREAVDHVTTTLKLIKARVPDVSLGRMRPFAAALRLRATDAAGAAAALADANPSIALAVPAIGMLLAGVPAAATDPTAGVIAARAIHDDAYLDKIGAETNEIGMAARALVAITKTDTALARAELGLKPPKTGLVSLINAVLAEIAGERKLLEQHIVQGLAGDQSRAVLAFAAAVGAFEKPTLTALVVAAEKVAPNAPGVTSLIGLAAAEAKVETPRALALISARELDELELKRLEPLVAMGADATSLRLRAELALRRGEDKAIVAIGTFASEASDDLRSARYQGWLLTSKGKFAEAAKAFEKAGSRREVARALEAANDHKAALAAVDGKPTTAEELVLVGQTAIAEGKLADAETTLLAAEQAAPVSPLVQATLGQLGAKQNNKERTRLAWLLSGVQGDIPTAPEPAPVIVAAGSQQKPAGSTPEKVVIDLQGADPRILEPMLEALTLAQYAKSKLVLAELGWSPSAFSFRQTHPEIVRQALVKLLSAPPYEMQVLVEPRTFDGDTIPLDELVKLTGELDGALVYRVQPDGGNARITLLHFKSGTTQATQVSRIVAMPEVVTFNTTKLFAILGAVLACGLVGLLFFTRSMGRIELHIARAADADEALCVEVTKNPKRPPIVDMLAFHNATKAAGTITKRRMATLIASGVILKVPTGTWYVHLYGTYSHAGKLRLVPENCTTQVEVKRGSTVDVDFDLVARAADVTIDVTYEPRKDVVVWANDESARRRVDDEGKVDLQLPIGHHTIHIQTPTDTLSMPLHVPTAKSIRMGVNVARELRLTKDLELGVDTEKAGELELVLSAGPRTPLPFAAVSDPTAVAKTQAASAADVAAAAAAGARHRRPRAATPVPGEVLFDRYRITSELGRGAMGIVQRAWDEKLEREVAIKVMADDLRAIPEAMALFTAEAKALAQLNHTNIVAMYDQVTDVDKVYMVMEYVDGQTLEQFIAARGPLPWFDAAFVIDQVCSGLAYAHARKIIHRDIKPANIFVANDKTVKLGDFGLARVMREVTIRRTEVRGTPLYMAPEQITGMDVDHRSDLYAIGCTLFELVCGRPPFIDGDIMYAQMNLAPPAPSSLRPDLPKAVDALILSLLQKSPDDRPGSANEVRATLRDISTV